MKQKTNIFCISSLFISLFIFYYSSELVLQGSFIKASLTSFLYVVGSLQGNIYDFAYSDNNSFENLIYIYSALINQIILIVICFGSIISYIFSLSKKLKLIINKNKKIIIFAEYNDKVRSIISSINEKSRIVICSKEVETCINNKSVIFVESDLIDFINDKKIIGHKCVADIYIFNNNEFEALNMVSRLCEAISVNNNNFNVYVDINELSWDIQELIISKYKRKNILINFIRTYENYAFNLLYKEPINKLLRIDNNEILIKVLFIGFNELNNEIFKNILTIAQLPNTKFEIVIIEEECNFKKLQFTCPEIKTFMDEFGESVYSIKLFDSYNIESVELFDIIMNNMPDYNIAYIDCREDIQNIYIAQQLIKSRAAFNSEKDYCIYLNCRQGIECLNTISEKIKIIGDYSTIYSVDNIKMPLVEFVAQKFHYLRNKDKNISWNKYANNEYARRSVYNRILCLRYKLYVIRNVYDSKYDKLKNDEDWIRAEHMRWNMFVRSSGFRYAQDKNLSIGLHPDLVNYNSLDDKKKKYDQIEIDEELLSFFDN